MIMKITRSLHYDLQIGDHSDLANRIKQLNLELSFGMQPPRDLLDVINGSFFFSKATKKIRINLPVGTK